MTKPEIDYYFQTNYKKLQQRCTAIVGSKLYNSKNKANDADDLLSFLCTHVYEHLNNFTDSTETQFTNFCIMFLNNNWRWGNSNFRTKNFNKRLDYDTQITDSITNFEVQESSWENISFDAPEQVKNYVKDLSSSDLSDESVTKVCYSLMHRNNLIYTDKILFDFYFIEGLSMQAIAKKCRLPLTSVFNMLKSIKTEIKTNHKTLTTNGI